MSIVFAPGFRGFHRIPSTATYISSAHSTTSSGSSFSWSSVTMGTTYDHLIVGFSVANGSGNSGFVNGCTIAGTSAIQLGSGSVLSNGGGSLWIVAKSIASGTIACTTNTSINLGGGAPYPIAYSLWGIQNLQSMTPLDTDSGTGDTIPISLNSSAYGFVVTCGGDQNFSARSISGSISTMDYNPSQPGFWATHGNGIGGFSATFSGAGQTMMAAALS